MDGDQRKCSNAVDYLFNHLYLPRKLPQKDDFDITLDNEILDVLHFSTELLYRELQAQEESAALHDVSSMMSTWSKVHRSKLDSLLDSIRTLQSGQCLPVYIRMQNATIMIEKCNQSASVCWFQASSTSNKVTSSESDLFGWFPAGGVTVAHLGIMQSEALVRQIVDLAVDSNIDSTPLTGPHQETREVPKTTYVSEWLMAVLCADGTAHCTTQVQKKIRDEVLWFNAELPFRRSGLYFSAKVVLHLRLTSLLGKTKGDMAYKYVILAALHRVCKRWWRRRVESNANDLQFQRMWQDVGMQLLAKQARRMEKLHQLCDRAGYSTALVRTLRKSLRAMSSTIQRIRNVMTRDWHKVVRTLEAVDVSLPKFDVQQNCKDYIQSLKSAKPKIEKMKGIFQRRPASLRVSEPVSKPRNLDRTSFLNLDYLDVTDETERGLALQDAENWIRLQSLRATSKFTVYQYYDLYEKYLKTAAEHYNRDPIGNSGMTLAAVRVLLQMDRQVVALHPLLGEYKVGIPEDLLELLLLRTKDELDDFSELKRYIYERNGAAKQDSCLLNRNPKSPSAFGVRFAKSDERMSSVKQRILEHAELKEREKLEEVRRERKRYERLCQEERELSHACGRSTAGYRTNTLQCLKCNKGKEARSVRVGVYESPLPSEAEDSSKFWAVIFELCIPDEMALLRNALHLLLEVVLHWKTTNPVYPFKSWLQLSQKLPGVRDTKVGNRPILVTIGSQRKPISSSHFFHHSAQLPIEKMFVKNNMEVDISTLDCPIKYVPNEDLFSYYTFQLENDYKSLEWTMDSTEHTENEVYCEQEQIPAALSVREFIRFGCLRAGHRVQLHNIVECIEARCLSFHRRSVVALIVQAVYQVGPLDGEQVEVDLPESQAMLGSAEFALAFLDTLEGLLDHAELNWQDNLVVLAVVVLASRIVSVSPAQAAECAKQLLLRCRKVSTEWEVKVESVMTKATSSAESGNAKALRLKLAVIAATSILTFGIDSNQVLLDEDSVTLWLKSNARLYENVLICGDSCSFLNSEVKDEEHVFIRNLLRQVHKCRVVCESRFFQLITTDNQLLSKFVAGHWPDGKSGEFTAWKRLSSESWWYRAKYKSGEHESTLDLSFDGQFLVNGRPVGKLAQTIQSSELFKRVFKDTLFDVYPAADGAEGMVSREYNGRCYTFTEVDGCVFITEKFGDSQYLLLRQQVFTEDLPTLFCTEYSHWMDVSKRSKREVHFRPVLFSDSKFTSADYVLNLIDGKLKSVQKASSYLLDRASPNVKQLYTGIFQRLEEDHYVHAFSNDAGTKLSIELPRYGLHFEWKGSAVTCVEYSNMHVSLKRNLGTLFGFQYGVVLEHRDRTRPKLYLVPHAKFHSNYAVGIDLKKDLREPKYFAFEIDVRVRQLKPAKSDAAVFYLAYLHAITSSALPDAFTGLTGSERALQMLQSAAAFSCKPYDEESIDTLKAIAELSPNRAYYPKGKQVMQTVNFHGQIPPSQALDAYRIIVHELVELSLRSAYAFPQANTGVLKDLAKLERLHIRGMRRSARQLGHFAFGLGCNKHKPAQPKADDVNFSLNQSHVENVRHLVQYWNSPFDIKPHETGCNVAEYLSGMDHLAGVNADKRGQFEFPKISQFLMHDIPDWLRLYKDDWLKLCDYATNGDCSAEQTAYLVVHLSLYAFKGVPLSELMPLLILKCRNMSTLSPPQHQSYCNTSQCEYSEKAVKDQIVQHSRSLEDFKRLQAKLMNESQTDFDTRTRREYHSSLSSDCRTLESRARTVWMQQTTSLTISLDGTSQLPYVTSCLSKLLQQWRNNLELRNYLAELTKKLAEVTARGHDKFLKPVSQSNAKSYNASSFADSWKFQNRPVVFDGVASNDRVTSESFHVKSGCASRMKVATCELPVQVCSGSVLKALRDDLERSWRCFFDGQNESSSELVCDQLLQERLEEVRTSLKAKLRSYWSLIKKSLSPSNATHRALYAAGLWPQILPSTILPCICSYGKQLELQLSLCDSVKQVVIEFATVSVELMRIVRCLSYCRSGDKLDRLRVEKELQSVAHASWKPTEYPDWLLFELENNLTIRPLQVQVALKMLEPEEDESAVMQLNMGEGKTAVIVPMVLLRLADGEKLARLTVLSSLLQSNFTSIKHKLGWLLKRRTYQVPISRDMQFTQATVATFRNILQECCSTRGVLLTVAEYRNSLKLKCLEKCYDEQQDCAKQLVQLWQWLQRNARDVLDESDMILHAKFQLVYTIGLQQNVDGVEIRWQLGEEVLKLAAQHMKYLHETYGDEHVHYAGNHSDVVSSVGVGAKPFLRRFPEVRLLSVNLYQELCERICEDVLSDKTSVKFCLPSRVIYLARHAVLQENVTYKLSEELESSKAIRLLRGLLTYNVLASALTKRWRVNYGLKTKQTASINETCRRMAVPFRGKDMPSEHTEFGHADMAILLTVLSYYYSGLTDEQLDEVHAQLQLRKEWDSECGDWLKSLGNADKKYNLGDPEQKRELYDLIRFYPPVIDAYMNLEVFPREAKTFPLKLCTSAWDLAEASGAEAFMKYPTTGFSGTNETRYLLPTTISQKDLPEVHGTNGLMIHNFLKSENNSYFNLARNAYGKSILKEITRVYSQTLSEECCSSEVRVLLDVGGLVIDLDNRQVAQQWLHDTPTDRVLAALYFDTSNRLMVLDRAGTDHAFEHSPYQTSLEKCVIYLDDAHTRGTDMQFPDGFRGCVTLGKDVTKDRLLQACMRMRMLGNGHSVCFYASHDVHVAITALRKKLAAEGNNAVPSAAPGCLDVLNWALNNSGQLIEEGFQHWSRSAASYWRRATVYSKFVESGLELRQLAESSAEPERHDIMQMYSLSRTKEELCKLVESDFRRQREAILSNCNHFDHWPLELEDKVLSVCRRYMRQAMIACHNLGEEQERELEPEKKEERQTQRPCAEDPNEPSLHDDLCNFAKFGVISLNSEAIWPLLAAFFGTKLDVFKETGTWDRRLLITRDFKKVTQRSVLWTEDFMRAPRWVAVDVKNDWLVILSQFEANELLPTIIKFGGVSLHLFSAITRKDQRQLFCKAGLVVTQNLQSRSASMTVAHSPRILAQLNVFGGSTHFETDADRTHWQSFLGLDLNRFESAQSDSGDQVSLLSPNSRLSADRSVARNRSFTESPVACVRQLIQLRNHGIVPKSSDVLAILDSLDPSAIA